MLKFRFVPLWQWGACAVCLNMHCHNESALPQPARCAPAFQGKHQSPVISLVMESQLLRDGSLRTGRVAPCLSASSPRQLMGEQIVAIAAARIVDLPPSLRPQQLELHFEPTLPPNTPAIAAVEVHTASRSLIVTRSAMRLPSSIWLHEMAHLAMRGPRPQPLTASRVVDAIEEAFADVVAALILNDSIVGGSGWPLRDLAASPSFDEGFEQLGLPEAFDPHPLGLALARRLWSLRDLLQPSPLTSCLNQAEGLRVSRSIRQAVTSVVSGCPQSVKQPVAEALNLWLPQGLSVNRLN